MFLFLSPDLLVNLERNNLRHKNQYTFQLYLFSKCKLIIRIIFYLNSLLYFHFLSSITWHRLTLIPCFYSFYLFYLHILVPLACIPVSFVGSSSCGKVLNSTPLEGYHILKRNGCLYKVKVKKYLPSLEKQQYLI